jgi:hypothetical protein
MRTFFDKHDASKLFDTATPSDEEISELLAREPRLVPERLVEPSGGGVSEAGGGGESVKEAENAEEEKAKEEISKQPKGSSTKQKRKSKRSSFSMFGRRKSETKTQEEPVEAVDSGCEG